MITEKQIADMVELCEKLLSRTILTEEHVERLSAKVRSLELQVFHLNKGQSVSVGPNVPTDGG